MITFSSLYNLAPSLPIILESPANQHILVKTGDESLKLLCRVDGDGVIVHWQKNKRNISSSEVVDIQGKSEFTINNVTKRDEGIYQCVATNSAGLVTSIEATVIITGQLYCVCIYTCTCVGVCI